jgi:hypothetical protein
VLAATMGRPNRALQWALMQRPERGDLIPHTGGDEAKNLTAQQCRLLRNAIHDELARMHLARA